MITMDHTQCAQCLGLGPSICNHRVFCGEEDPSQLSFTHGGSVQLWGLHMAILWGLCKRCEWVPNSAVHGYRAQPELHAMAILHIHKLPQLWIREVKVPKCSNPWVQKENSSLDIVINGYRALFRKKMCVCVIHGLKIATLNSHTSTLHQPSGITPPDHHYCPPASGRIHFHS